MEEVERKEKGEKRSIDQSKVDDDPIMGCVMCLKKGHHWLGCPYRYRYPAGALVGSCVRIICWCCGSENDHPGRPGVDWLARCDMRCGQRRPTYEEELKALNITTPLEDDPADGIGQRKRIREGGEKRAVTYEDVDVSGGEKPAVTFSYEDWDEGDPEDWDLWM